MALGRSSATRNLPSRTPLVDGYVGYHDSELDWWGRAATWACKSRALARHHAGAPSAPTSAALKGGATTVVRAIARAVAAPGLSPARCWGARRVPQAVAIYRLRSPRGTFSRRGSFTVSALATMRSCFNVQVGATTFAAATRLAALLGGLHAGTYCLTAMSLAWRRVFATS